MYRLFLLGIAALIGVTSCVPPAAEHAAAPSKRAVTDPRALLRQLALDVPDDVAAIPALPPFADTAAATIFPNAAPPFIAATRGPDDAQRANDCLTAAIYYEARSEPVDGQRAVAQVVLNRVRDRAFPSSVCGVVYQGSERRTGCQFSFTCDGSMRHPRQWRAWAEAEAVASSALAGSVYAPVGSATHYHANYVLPWWASSLARIGAVGTHIFYRWRDGLERALAFRQQYAGWEPSSVTAPLETVADGATAASGVTVSNGVTIHKGRGASAELAGAVTIHRHATAPLAGDEATGSARSLNVAGVRIHRGATAPVGIAASFDESTASVAEDSGAI